MGERKENRRIMLKNPPKSVEQQAEELVVNVCRMMMMMAHADCE